MKTDKQDTGYIVHYGDDTGQNLGHAIDIKTKKLDFHAPAYRPIIDKLWINYDDLRQRLLEQTPEDEREHAEFYGFRQGHWRDPDTVAWGAGEGPLTMTVYNIEVEDTHTYFVGEAGIWVHNCGGEETFSNSLTVAQVQSLLPAAMQYWITAGVSEQELTEKLAGYRIEIQTLVDNVAAVTNQQAQRISFSPDASGRGWYVDATPSDSTEFTMQRDDLGRNNGQVAAAEHVDLLTVIIHELGQVLGMPVVNDPNDIMSGNLEMGMRRLPTAQDLLRNVETDMLSQNDHFADKQLMVAQNSVGQPIFSWRYKDVINDQFSQLSNSQAWQTRGSVTLQDNSVTLRETANTHTHLSQAFKLGSQDRMLSFTLNSQQLSDYNNSPDDAFEVALLDAPSLVHDMHDLGVTQ